MTDTTQALELHAAGERNATPQLLPLVYDQLRRLAGRYLRRERPGHSLQPTDLVHQAYLRMVDQTRISWEGKTHFFAIAATQMRRVLVDSARAHRARKRGGDLARVTLVESLAVAPGVSLDILALNEAIEKLSRLHRRQSQVVELRYFGGLSIREVAYALGVSERTAKGDWTVARVWLLRELSLSGKTT